MFKSYAAATISTLVLLYAPAALPSQWVTLSVSPTVSVDVDSIKGEGDTRNFWVRTIYNEERQVGFRSYRMVKSLTFVNCRNNEIGSMRAVLYSRNGGVVEDIDQTYLKVPAFVQSVIPDSIGEQVLQYICSLRTSFGGENRTYSNVSTSSPISRQQAVNVVRQWLQAKQEIFAPPFNQQLIRELTTGTLLNDLTSPNGPVHWLKNNNSHYTFGTQQIESTRMFATAGNDKAVVELRITEAIAFYQNGKVDSSRTTLKTNNVRYNLELTGDRWKIENYQILN